MSITTPRTPHRAVLTIATLALIVAAGVYAGPLSPPAGPVAATNKTLAEIEPRAAINAANAPGDTDSVYRITNPGSYYLTDDITAPVGKSAIEIAASNVTIDLNGFTITSLAALDAIRLSVGGRSNITIRNGHIGIVVGAGGIDIKPDISGQTPTRGGLIENISVMDTAGNGIRAGNAMVIRNCSSNSNAQSGFVFGEGSTLSGCVASENEGTGFSGNVGVTLQNCTAIGNLAFGFFATSDSSISNCTANRNGETGIYTASGGSCTVTNCAAADNTSNGISVGIGSVVNSCTASGNLNGIVLSNGSSVIDCSALANDVHGIECRSNAVVRGNVCQQNGTSSAPDCAGIHVLQGDNRIEGNNCTGADIGISCDGAGNIIFRNTCAANTTNWVIAADNIYGAIIDRRIPTTVAGTPAVNGHGATGTLGSTDSNANFSY